MFISDVIVKAFSAPYVRPITNGKYTYAATEIVFCELLTSDGIRGYGWTHGTALVIDTLMSLRDRVIGEDPFNYERIWEKMYLPKVYGRKGFATRAISAVDIALWDIMGKVAGRSLHQLLGGHSDKKPAYVAGGYYEEGKGNTGLIEEMHSNLSSGAKGVKIKIGRNSIAEDLARIDIVRDAIGSDVKLLVDANNSYNRLDAYKMGRELDKRDIYWFEEPLHPDDLDGCAELCRRLDTPIAIGENEYTRWGFQQIIEKNAAQIINADAQVLGGITEWRKVADIASANHILVAPHGDQEIHTHLVNAVPNGLIVEYYNNNTNALLGELFPNHINIDENGLVSAPTRPGLGVVPNFEAAAKYLVFDSVR